jgi:hypothetical protein
MLVYKSSNLKKSDHQHIDSKRNNARYQPLSSISCFVLTQRQQTSPLNYVLQTRDYDAGKDENASTDNLKVILHLCTTFIHCQPKLCRLKTVYQPGDCDAPIVNATLLRSSCQPPNFPQYSHQFPNKKLSIKICLK